MSPRRVFLALAALASQVLLPGAAAAQEAVSPTAAANQAAAPAPDVSAPKTARLESNVEEMTVTGSRVRRKDLTTPAPLTLLTKDEIQESGRVSIGDFLQLLPEQGNAINTQFNNGGDGSTRVNLRGLGTNRTLVLVNGRRFVEGGTGADATVDLNSIPDAVIDRVEVLKDGASAVYGSDAIGGVVNIITRKTFNGTEASVYGGMSSQNDGQVYDVSVITGVTGDKGDVMFSASYYDMYPVMAGARSWAATPIGYDFTAGQTYFNGSSATPPGRFALPGAAPVGTLAYNLQQRYPGVGNFIYDPSSPLAYRPFTGSDYYNYQPYNYLVTPQQRIQLYSAGDTHLGDVARAFYEASFVDRQSAQVLAPDPLFTSQYGLTMSKDSIYNPTGVDLYDVRRRLTEFGDRTQTQNVDTFRVVAGLDGSISSWTWDTAFNFGRTQSSSTTDGNLRTPYIQNAIGPSFYANPTAKTGATCGTPSAPIANCVPLDLLHAAGPITPAQIAGLGFMGIDQGYDEQVSWTANTSGDLFTLFSDRPVGFAAGLEYRRELAAYLPDPITAAGESDGNNSLPTSGGYSVAEAYAELVIPILSNVPFVHDLELDLAARSSNYSTFGTDTTYKIGARWAPVRDVTLRGTYSTAYRAPAITELYSGQFDNFEAISDPCAGSVDPASPKYIKAGSILYNQCTNNGKNPKYANNGDDRTQLRAKNGGNPNLQPETAKTLTAGVVVQPRWVDNLSLTVDFYHIDVTNSISTIGGGTILAGCYSGNTNQNAAYCNLIQRDPNSGLISTVYDLNNNVGGDRTAGIDFGAQYMIPTNAGRFNVSFDGTYLAYYDRTLADGTIIHARGTYDLGVYPSFKFNTAVNWAFKKFGAGLDMRFIGSFKECGNTSGVAGGDGLCYVSDQYSRQVASYAAFDTYVSYSTKNWTGKTSVSVGINNLTDQRPAVIYDGFLAASDASTYDYMGRYFYARLTQSF